MEPPSYPTSPPYEASPSYPTAPDYAAQAWQQPPAPPAPPYGPFPEWQAPPPAPRRPARVGAALVAVALLLLSTIVGFAIGTGLLTNGTSSSVSPTAERVLPGSSSTNSNAPAGTEGIVAAVDP